MNDKAASLEQLVSLTQAEAEAWPAADLNQRHVRAVAAALVIDELGDLDAHLGVELAEMAVEVGRDSTRGKARNSAHHIPVPSCQSQPPSSRLVRRIRLYFGSLAIRGTTASRISRGREKSSAIRSQSVSEARGNI